MYTSGVWNDFPGGEGYYGVIEVAGSDTDGDGLLDSIDPYPADPLNAFDLRAAGADGNFFTADDQVYHLASSGYDGGLSAFFGVMDEPLQPGKYRFTVTTSLKDRAGNVLAAAFTRNFTVAGVPGFVLENRDNNSIAGATTLSLSPSAQADGSFTVGNTFNVGGNNPWFVVAGRFDGDTNLDVALANYGSANIGVLLGNGNGSFQPVTNYATANNPIALALGDLNGDGKLDLVSANRGANNVGVLLGNGDGTFQTATNYATGSSQRSVAVGDFNRDNRLDVVTANEGNDNVSVLLGNGDGTLAGQVRYATGNGPFSVQVRDLNGDGKLDLVTANVNSDNVSVLLGNGDGTFGAAANYGVGNAPRSVGIGDLNGDGKVDLAVLNAGANTVSVLLGNGDGTFAAAVNYGSGSSDPYHVLVVDLNGDGRLDSNSHFDIADASGR